MKPLRILHVVRAGNADGGMETGIVNLVNRMDERFSLSICALDSRETFSTKIRRPEVKCFCLPLRGHGVDWSLVGRLANLIRREQIDIVHSHNWGALIYGVIAGRLAKTGIIHGEHGKNFSEMKSESRVKRLAKTWLGRRTDLLLSVCEEIRAEWIARYRVNPGRMRSIPNGVDSARFAPAPSPEGKRAMGLPPDAFVAGTVGRLDPIKNLEPFLGAVARLAREIPSLHAVFLGDGPLEAELRGKTDALSLGDRVHFLGRRREVEQLLPGFDAFVLPSVSEGMSNVLLEAMSCAVAPICSDLPSHHEVVTPGIDAVLLKPCDEVTLSEALRNFYCDPSARSRIAANARQTVLRRFTLERMIAEYQEAYLQVQRRGSGG